MPCLDLGLELADERIEVLEVLGQPSDQLTEQARKWIARVFEQARHALGDVRDPGRHDQAELAQETADLVGLGGARLDESLAHPMQREHGLLLHALHRDEAHVGQGVDVRELTVGTHASETSASRTALVGPQHIYRSASVWLRVRADVRSRPPH